MQRLKKHKGEKIIFKTNIFTKKKGHQDYGLRL